MLDPCLREVESFAVGTKDLLEAASAELSGVKLTAEKAVISARHLKDYRQKQQTTIFALSQLAIFGESHYDKCVAILENLEDEIVSAVGEQVYGAQDSTAGVRGIRVEATKLRLLKYLKEVHANLF